MPMRTLAGLVFVLLHLVPAVRAQVPDPRGVDGARLIAGGGKLPAAIYKRFVELAGGEQARIVLILTASGRADDPERCEETLRRWQREHPQARFELLHTRDRAEADSEEFTAPLRQASGVWFGGGAQDRLAAAYVGTRVERELHALLARGGVVGGSSAGAAIQSRTMIERGMDPPVLGTGFDLVPFAIVDQHFLKRSRLPRLLRALALAPGRFGIGIDEGTAIVVRGRRAQVLGDSKVLFVLPPTHERPQRIVARHNGEVVDLCTWQRCARQRALGPWPPPEMPAPRVARGSLVLGGGGRLPDEVFARFVQLARGKDARIVLVPAAMPADAPPMRHVEGRLRRLGVRDIRTLSPRHPSDVKAEHVAMLDRATGVWFGGGRQWRIVDAFEGTGVEVAFHRVLQRGGVIGGSSAGATIQGEVLARGNPLGNRDIWCEGYDRGFGFLPGTVVDQHFSNRNRLPELQHLITRFPQVLGVGIDEATAAIVRGSSLEVVGAGRVAIVDARAAPDTAPTTLWLEPGEDLDLTETLH